MCSCARYSLFLHIAEKLTRITDNMDFFGSRIVLRPQEISNHSGIIRHLSPPCNPVKRQVMLFIFFSKIVDPFNILKISILRPYRAIMFFCSSKDDTICHRKTLM
ncbi:hypothetical protein Dpo_2c04080 [Desulfotignum phosphitoxidans DSM 13687]|uniref:Uncharacterized protein n=1 Tax=Desulfotignum phosphitoxidans DSM 13687 TaxID=1286635 RepID=S0G700_9BACT|nr:hypothetical protein Dpo_2c04080 [Desulfotignum phosphitoxidans DSM 13687]